MHDFYMPMCVCIKIECIFINTCQDIDIYILLCLFKYMCVCVAYMHTSLYTQNNVLYFYMPIL